MIYVIFGLSIWNILNCILISTIQNNICVICQVIESLGGK